MADDNKRSASDFRKQAEEQIKYQKLINSLNQEEFSGIEKIFSTRARLSKAEEDYYKKYVVYEQKLKIFQEAKKAAQDKSLKIHHQTLKALEKDVKRENELLKKEELKYKYKLLTINALGKIGDLNKNIWGFLMDSDKVIRNTTRELGLSGAKAEILRTSFEDAAHIAARYGGSLEDIQTILTTFADETGRAKALSGDMLENYLAIGKGTGIGIEAAARLGGQFELMGLNAKNTYDYVEGIVESGEKMGINTTKALKGLSSNFSKLQKYTFQSGVKGMKDMALYAEKFKVDISQTLDSAEKARTLEGAIDMMANLQVMGGEFAKTDPFEMMYLSRNAPEEYTKKINEMTKGLVTFKKMSDGTFEKFITPVDMDRIRNVSKTLGIDEKTLTDQAYRMAEIQKIRQQMQGLGLSNEQKTLVEGMANFDKRTGRFSVNLGQSTKDISELTQDELKILNNQSKSLKERATNALTFDDSLKATIMELKSALLPFLTGINSMLDTIRPFLSSIGDFANFIGKNTPSWLKIAGGIGLLASVKIISPIVSGLNSAVSGRLKNFGADLGGGAKEIEKNAPPTGGLKSGMGKGFAAAGIGAGIGLAGAGIGEGINLAATGISKLADAMSKLDDKKAEALKSIVSSIAIVTGIGAVAAAVIMGIGIASDASAVGIGALSLGILGIGAGIGIATAGIGAMGLGISKMIDSAKGAGEGLGLVATNIAGIGLAMAGSGIGAVLGGGAMVLGLKQIANQAPAIAQIGTAFKEINTTLSGTESQFNSIKGLIASISGMDMDKLSSLSKLADVFNKPIKVEFSDKEVGFIANMSLNVDGNTIYKELNIPYKTQASNLRISTGKEQPTRSNKG